MDTGEHKPDSGRFFSSTAIAKIMRLSRKTLRYYNDMNVCKPACIGKNNRYRYYSASQVDDLMLVKASSEMGVPIAELPNYFDSHEQVEFSQLMDRAYLETTDRMRRTRRTLKNIVHCQQLVQDLAGLGVRDGYYLRYIPERWCALLPISHHEDGMIPVTGLAERLMHLNDAVDSYGWAGTLVNGMLASLSSTSQQGFGYIFIELSSPPMPEFTGGMVIDGGCYRTADEMNGCAGCTCKSCATCARMGRMLMRPDGGDEVETFPSLTLMVDDLDEPYLSGPWCEFTKRKIAERETHEPGSAEERPQVGAGPPNGQPERGGPGHRGPHANPTLRPMLMPHLVRLPGGVTACALPAGDYLCKQHEAGTEDVDFEEMLSMATKLPRRTFSRQEEEELHLRTPHGKGWPPAPPKGGPVAEPFAEPRVVGDPERRGWFEDLPEGDFSGMHMLMDTGLIPGSDFCIVDSRMLFPTQSTTPRKEFQILVEMDG